MKYLCLPTSNESTGFVRVEYAGEYADVRTRSMHPRVKKAFKTMVKAGVRPSIVREMIRQIGAWQTRTALKNVAFGTIYGISGSLLMVSIRPHNGTEFERLIENFRCRFPVTGRTQCRYPNA